MCFSAAASFAAAGVLAPMGVYCVRAARRRLPRYRLFATIPLGFAVQQASEGFVWLGVMHGPADWVPVASAIYLFFALAWWPFWFPLSAAFAATRPLIRRLLAVWALLSTGWFFLAYLPVLLDPTARLVTEVVHHSIRYAHADEVVFGPAARWPVTMLYSLCCAGPLLLLARRELLFPVVIGPVFAAVAWTAYTHAYTSVWCFFAAILSAYSVYFFATAEPEAVLTA